MPSLWSARPNRATLLMDSRSLVLVCKKERISIGVIQSPSSSFSAGWKCLECIFCLNENAYFDGVNYVCPDCGREWPCDEIADDDDDNNKLRCPECGSHLVYPDSSGINDYACDACGCRWDGDDDDYDEDYDDDDED